MFLQKNEKAYEIWQRELYDPNKIFEKNNQSQVNNVEAEQAIAVKPKESLFTKMINRIRRMFGKGNN